MRLRPHEIHDALELQASRYTRALDTAQAIQSARKADKHTARKADINAAHKPVDSLDGVILDD